MWIYCTLRRPPEKLGLGDTASLRTSQGSRLDTQATAHILTHVIFSFFCAHPGLTSPVPAAFWVVVESTDFDSYEVQRQEKHFVHNNYF